MCRSSSLLCSVVICASVFVCMVLTYVFVKLRVCVCMCGAFCGGLLKLVTELCWISRFTYKRQHIDVLQLRLPASTRKERFSTVWENSTQAPDGEIRFI